MDTVRKNIMRWSPALLWVLALSMGYTLFVYLLDTQIYTQGTQQAVAFYYVRGWLLAVPLVLCNIAAKKTKHIIQFILFGLMLFGIVHFVVGCICFTILTIGFWLVRFSDRVSYQAKIDESIAPDPCMFDDPSWWLAGFAVGCFLVAGMTDQVFAQEVSVLHGIAILLVFFVYRGLQRFETYVRLNKTSANLPSRRILDTGTRIFVSAALVVVLVFMPMVKLQYQFIPVSTTLLKFITGQGIGVVAVSNEKKEEREEPPTWSIAQEEDVLLNIGAISTEIECVIVLISFGGMAWLLFFWIYGIAKNFNRVQIEKDDVIESTFDKQETLQNTARRRQKIKEWFDFSESMQIRRRYKKELKKSNPKPWQTPTEIEVAANKNMPELHDRYEKVRYGESG